MFALLFNKIHVLFKRQFGFCKNHASKHALVNLAGLIKKYGDKNYFICAIFTDLQKSFDTINHDILFAKLEHYVAPRQANNYLQSFLTAQIGINV